MSVCLEACVILYVREVEQKLAQTAFDASVTMEHGVLRGVEEHNCGCASEQPGFGGAEANGRLYFGNATPRTTYFAAMGLLQHTC